MCGGSNNGCAPVIAASAEKSSRRRLLQRPSLRLRVHPTASPTWTRQGRAGQGKTGAAEGFQACTACFPHRRPTDIPAALQRATPRPCGTAYIDRHALPPAAVHLLCRTRLSRTAYMDDGLLPILSYRTSTSPSPRAAATARSWLSRPRRTPTISPSQERGKDSSACTLAAQASRSSAASRSPVGSRHRH